MLDIQNISLTPMSIGLFVFYLIIAGNYMAELFGCKVQYIFGNYQLAKHIIGFMTMFFFVSLTQNEFSKKSPITKLLYTALTYVWFLMSIRTNYVFTLILIIMLGAIYMLEVFKKDEIEYRGETEDSEKIKNMGTAQKYLKYGAVLTTIIGFLVYLGDRKTEFGEEFEWSKFFQGKTTCDFDDTDDLLGKSLKEQIGDNLFDRTLMGIKTLSPIK